MDPFALVTEAELAQARKDRAFRQRLLTRNLELLLGKLQTQRRAARTATATATASQMREGVTLAVRLAELIRTTAAPPRRS
ncbi:MAG: hypothetical protein ACLPX7_24125 [Xanthobacteraceae bacterium]